jgi:hypothetical protein
VSRIQLLLRAAKAALRAFKWAWRTGREQQRRDLERARDHTSSRFSTQTLENSERTIVAHTEGSCVGRRCPLHKRSQHSMRAWPQLWRDDAYLMERTCPHGIGHPDPDDPNSKDYRHGCDGCCQESE